MKNWVHHIVLAVSNVATSSKFYRDVLDWDVRSEGDDFAEFTCPGDPEGRQALFAIVQANENERFVHGRVGLEHFAFMVESREELKAIEQRLRDKKIEMEDGGITDDGYGGTTIFCSDPDGMKVEFHLK